MPKKSLKKPARKLPAPRDTVARTRISQNLKLLRKSRGLSQEALAELASFHRTYVSQLERRVTNVSIDGLERLAAALAVDVRELLKPVD